MRRRAVSFYNIKIDSVDIERMQSRARELLLEREDFNVGAAWIESVLEYLKNEKLLIMNETEYFSNGERMRK